jgi:excisionase family DNA binding protein
MSERRLLTARELGEQLGVSTGALLRWTRSGQVPAVKLPSGAVRYRPEDIETWLNDHTMADGADREAPATDRTARRPVFSPAASYRETPTEED